MVRLTINGKTHEVDVDPNTPLLWAIREQVGLTGTKYGCGVAQCGACTVHLDGAPVRSCVMPVSVGRRQEDHHHRRPGASGSTLHKVQKAWIKHDVPQCGYCQSRHDHGGRGAARRTSRSRPTRTSMPRSPTSAAAARSSKCARRSTTAAKAEEPETSTP